MNSVFSTELSTGEKHIYPVDNSVEKPKSTSVFPQGEYVTIYRIFCPVEKLDYYTAIKILSKSTFKRYFL